MTDAETPTQPSFYVQVPDPVTVLATPMRDNDAGASTIHEYLIALLRAIWDEGEGFSGKRPFGNSCWEWDLYDALATAGLVTVVFDEDGYIADFVDGEQEKANNLIHSAIDYLAVSRD